MSQEKVINMGKFCMKMSYFIGACMPMFESGQILVSKSFSRSMGTWQLTRFCDHIYLNLKSWENYFSSYLFSHKCIIFLFIVKLYLKSNSNLCS